MSGACHQFVVLLLFLSTAGPAFSNERRDRADPGAYQRALREAQRPRDAKGDLDQINLPLKLDATPLLDSLEFLRDVSRINLFINWRALEAAGIKRELKITLHVKEMSFREHLGLVLAEAGKGGKKVGFLTSNEVVYISTIDDLKKMQAFRERHRDEVLPPSDRKRLAERFLVQGRDIVWGGGFDCEAAPVTDMLKYCSERTNTPIYFEEGFRKAAVPATAEVSAVMENVALEEILATLLSAAAPAGALDYKIKDGVITVFAVEQDVKK